MTRKFLLLSVLFFAFGSVLCTPLSAQVLTTLHTFNDGTVANDGNQPVGLTLGSDGNLYGVTNAGGNAGASEEGIVFKMTPSGAVTVLHLFTTDSNSTSSNLDGADAEAGVVQGSDGNFYGTTAVGGTNAVGVVYKITPGGTFTTLHDFGDGSVPNDGIGPTAALVQGSDGNFYGTTLTGGSAGNGGTVFKITPSGTETVLHRFGDGTVANDGAGPNAALIQGRDGNFYGTTEGGGASGYGAVFEMTSSGTVTILHSFSATGDGEYPFGALLQAADGNFYGTTNLGGTNGSGTIYKLTPSGALTIIYSFSALPTGGTNSDGANPTSALTQGSDGNLYGTAYDGGANGSGSVFKITPFGSLTTLYSFSSTLSGVTNSDGTNPMTGLVPAGNGTFYGLTEFGGSAGGGTVFRLGASGTPSLTVTSLAPALTPVNGPAFTLTINGTGFTGSTTVTFGSTPVTVTARSATKLMVTVPASAITAVGPVTVTATDPVDGTGSITFSVTSLWNVRDVAAVADGTARLLWTQADGAAGIWVVSAADAQTAVGPTYGPYQGWSAQDITAAPDGTSRILWNRYDGATGIWVMDAHGNQTAAGPTYGPFTGWKSIDLATAPDGTSRLLWRYTNGQAGLLSLNAQGSQVISGRSYGPYTGWTATAVGAAGDGTARILWTRSDGAMGIWTMDSGDLQKTVGPTYGPYSDSHGTWTATDLSTSSDGTSCVLWKRSDGAVGVWTFSAANTAVTSGAVYGPFPGWTAAAMDAANDKARVLWVQSTRAAGLWSFGGNDAETLIGPIYGPY